MEYSGEGVGVYAEAKGEYTRQLCQLLTPAFLKYFLEMLDLAKERETDPKKHLIEFQNLLEGVSEWNMIKVQRETQSVAIYTQCDYLEELLTAVFIAHTKVLSAIRLTNRQKKLQITIPKLEHFLHKTMTECARILWTNTFLFAASGSALERQKNMRQVENLINEGVLQGVRSMLPVKSILREYLTAEESEGETDAEEDAEEEKVGAEAETEAAEPKVEAAEPKVEAAEPKVEAAEPKAEAAEPKVEPEFDAEPESESESKTKSSPKAQTEPEQVGPTGAATETIPVIDLNDVSTNEDSNTRLFKDTSEQRPTTPSPPQPPAPAPARANVIKESEPSLLEDMEEVADLPIFEDEFEAKAKGGSDENDFEFEELS